ncbi:MAG: DUF4159 domain-containing protein [Planctomycetes bacterium]|nr:DUF4159 domain-containing protein [Planctomycetota bacterium]
MVLILDTSDSMADVIEAMKLNAEDMVDTLRQHARLFRVGLITYGYEDPKFSPLTDDAGAILRAIRRLKHFGNYEPIDQALDMALKQMKWRDKARKVIILVGDEEPDNDRRDNGIYLSFQHASECARRGITVHTVSATPGGKPIFEFTEIAERGKGVCLSLEGARDLPGMLLSLSLGYGGKTEPPELGREIDYGIGPTLIAKLDLGKGWNLDRGDVAALLADAKDDLPERFSWQVVKEDASWEELAKARILYLSAHGDFEFSEELRAKVRKFIQAGGFLLADDCCGDPAFDKSFQAELQKILPGRALEKLPKEHRFYHTPRKIAKDTPRALYGIPIGCRTAVVYCRTDLSCRWVNGPDLGKGVSEKQAFDLGANILHRIVFYNTAIATAAGLRANPGRPKQVIGQVRFDGFWNPAIHVLDPIFPAVFGGKDQTVVRPVTLTDKGLYDYPILYLTGHGDIRLSKEAKAALRGYLERGGFLFAEACCGDREFDQSFRLLMAELFPHGLRMLPAAHPVFHMAKDVTQVTHVPSGKAGPPELEAVLIENQAAVIYTPLDLTAALLDHPGFCYRSVAKADARALLTNILLYALSH